MHATFFVHNVWIDFGLAAHACRHSLDYEPVCLPFALLTIDDVPLHTDTFTCATMHAKHATTIRMDDLKMLRTIDRPALCIRDEPNNGFGEHILYVFVCITRPSIGPAAFFAFVSLKSGEVLLLVGLSQINSMRAPAALVIKGDLEIFVPL